MIAGQENYLEDCIKSILYGHKKEPIDKLLLINDGNKISSKNKAEELLSKEQIKYEIHSWERIGIERSLNRGLSLIESDWYVRCDGDDILGVDYFTTLKKHIDKKYSEDYSSYFSPYFKINSHGKRIDHSNIKMKIELEDVIKAGDILASGMSFKTETVLKIGGYKTDIINSGLENYDLVIRLLKSGEKFKNLGSYLTSYRIHENSISQNKTNIILNNGMIINSSYSLPRYTRGHNHPQDGFIN